MKTDLREKLAALCHDQWIGWMEYLFSRCELVAVGAFSIERYVHAITAWDYERWQRQMQTPYSELSEKEKDSNRKESDKFLKIIDEKLKFVYDLILVLSENKSLHCLEAQSDLSEFYIGCNDFFMWGCSDAEDITVETLPILQQAFKDAPDDGALLYCARQRKMRPQGACYKWIDKENWPLFDECGDVRPADFGNPQERPTE